MDPPRRATVPVERIRTLSAIDLGTGPWGASASPTTVGRTRLHDVPRTRRILDGPAEEQVRAAVDALEARGAFAPRELASPASVPPTASPQRGLAVAVAVEPAREHLTRELLGRAAQLAHEIHGHVVAIGTEVSPHLGAQGADLLVHLDAGPVPLEEDVARGIAHWAAPRTPAPWAILAPGTAWGREVAARVAARLDAGLTGDAVALEVDDDRLVAWKPAFGGQLVAEILTSSPTQLATVRAGVLDDLRPRPHVEPLLEALVVEPRGRASVRSRTRDDDIDVLADADVVVGVGQAIPPDAYATLDPLLGVLDAELGATRKVTDQGWQPRARQIGITGRCISPRLYVALGLGGKFNHMVGVRSAETVLAVNSDAQAPVFDAADVGIVADWHEAVPLLVAELESRAGVGATALGR